jgi:hypothetical protein
LKICFVAAVAGRRNIGCGAAAVGEEDFLEAFLGLGPAIGFAGSGSAPNGLQPVLAEGCEVDQEVGGVGQAVR